MNVCVYVCVCECLRDRDSVRIWLKVPKTSPVANIVPLVYKISSMALIGI